MTAAAEATQSAQEIVLDAHNSGLPLRISGRAHWMSAGRPSPATRILSLAAHSGVVDYVPGDLTITVRSGTSLAEIGQVTRAEGQWLPLDPYGTADGTIGATIATGSFGPLAHGFGHARDLVLGVEFITGEGKVVRGGGRVVKNVAGFDLVRLVTGSWGTIGVITEATLRLYSLPLRPITVGFNLPDGAGGIAQRIGAILSGAVTPFAVEMIDAALSAEIGLSSKAQVLVQLGGNAAAVTAQRDALARLGGIHEVAGDIWGRLRTIEEKVENGNEDHAPLVIRISSVPARLPEVWTNVQRAAVKVAGSMIHATPGFGVVRCILPALTPVDAVQTIAKSTPGTMNVFERLPAAMWPLLSPTVIPDRISQGIKRAFDPRNVLNPDILGPLT